VNKQVNKRQNENKEIEETKEVIKGYTK
jgi:hypothetical protein